MSFINLSKQLHSRNSSRIAWTRIIDLKVWWCSFFPINSRYRLISKLFRTCRNLRDMTAVINGRHYFCIPRIWNFWRRLNSLECHLSIVHERCLNALWKKYYICGVERKSYLRTSVDLPKSCIVSYIYNFRSYLSLRLRSNHHNILSARPFLMSVVITWCSFAARMLSRILCRNSRIELRANTWLELSYTS